MKKKFNFFLSALLVLLFITLSGSCFAIDSNTYSLTMSEFKNILSENNLTLDENINTSVVSEALGKSPLIINECYSTSTNYNNYLKIICKNSADYYPSVEISGTTARIRLINKNTNSFANATVYNFGYNEDGILYYINRSMGSTSSGVYADYSQYSNDYTQTEFNTFSFQKRILIEKVLYYEGGIGWGTTSNDLMYKFDGVFKGNGTQEPYTSSFTANNTSLRFEYTAYTDLTNSNVVNYFFLQEFTPSQAINLTDEDLNFNDSDEQISMNTKLESNFSYTSLIRRMQQGYIYRLYCFSNQQNQSGDLIRTTDATSCFFSLNSWKSNDITVLNIYDIMFPENPDIEQEGGTSGGVIDLENIENSINNSNKDYWGDPDNINPEDFENELENNFNGIMENLSGELTQNQIFESLQGAEDGFLNFFREDQNEQFYDLAFSWPDVEFMGETLIPAGGINISEMCREIPELETLRSYIRVIFNFSVAVTLIKQIYNLILGTLGIDNPYLYEDYDEVTAIDTDTGEYKEMAYKRKRIYNRRR